MTVYDVHAHCVPPGLPGAVAQDGGRSGVEVAATDQGQGFIIGGRATGAVREDLTDVAARLAAMDRAGVDVQLVSSWIGLTGYTLPAAAGARWARLFNEQLAAMVADQPHRFRGLGTVPLQSGEQAAAELRHAVEQLGLVGAEIATTVTGRDLDDRDLDPFWTAADDLGAIILIHPDQVLAGRPKPRHFLNNTVGNAAETTIAVGHLLGGGVLARHPDLRLVLVHGGGYLPWQAGRLDHGYAANPRLVGPELTAPPSTYLRRLYYDTVLHSTDALRFLLAFAGADHVVVGTDHPFEMGQADPLGLLTAIPELTADERYAIRTGNVERLLGGVRGRAGTAAAARDGSG